MAPLAKGKDGFYLCHLSFGCSWYQGLSKDIFQQNSPGEMRESHSVGPLLEHLNLGLEGPWAGWGLWSLPLPEGFGFSHTGSSEPSS